MNLRHLLIPAAVLPAVLAFAGAASANDFNVGTCGAGGYPTDVLSVNIGLYGEHAPNHLTVTVAGHQTVVTFTDGYSHTFPTVEGNVWTVDLTTSQGGGAQHRTGTIHCITTTTTTTGAPPSSSTSPPSVPSTSTTPPTSTIVPPATTHPASSTTAPNASTLPPATTTSSVSSSTTAASSPESSTTAARIPTATTPPDVTIPVPDGFCTPPRTVPGCAVPRGCYAIVANSDGTQSFVCDSVPDAPRSMPGQPPATLPATGIGAVGLLLIAGIGAIIGFGLVRLSRRPR